MTELQDILPFCNDINNIIIEKVKPYRFEIGSYYKYKKRNGYYKIIRKTKYMVYFCYVFCQTNKKPPYILRRKRRYDINDNEYLFLHDSRYCVFAKNKKVFD